MAKKSKHFRLSDPILDVLSRLQRKLTGQPPQTRIVEEAIKDFAKKHGEKVREGVARP